MPDAALEAFAENPDQFDLVITDFTMPQMTGDKLAALILKHRPEIAIRVNTGFYENLSPGTIESIGVRNILIKPVKQKELAQAIRKALTGLKGPALAPFFPSNFSKWIQRINAP